MFVITKKIRNNFDPFQSLSIYRERNIVETAFRQFKVLNGADRLYCTQTSYKGKIFIHLLAQTLRMMMSVSATRNQTADNKLPSDSLNKLMLKLQTLQASRPLGRGIWIVKEIPKKLEISSIYLVWPTQKSTSKIRNYDSGSLGWSWINIEGLHIMIKKYTPIFREEPKKFNKSSVNL